MRHDDAFVHRVRAVLDPILTRHGFAEGQGDGGLHPEGANRAVVWASADPACVPPPPPPPPPDRLVTSLTFCAAPDRLSPGALALVQGDHGADGPYCVDLVLEGSSTIGITRADYELRPLPEALRAAGLPTDADRVGHLPSGDLDADLDVVATGLRSLFEEVG